MQLKKTRRRIGHHSDLFLGKVERRLDQHAQLDQPVDQYMDSLRKFASHGAQRRSCRLRRCRLDQIGHRLRLGQIQLVVEEGAAGKLAGFCEPRAEFEAAGEQ